MRRLLEFSVVMVVLAVLAGLLLQRLAGVRDEAARVQLRMAVEAVRLNAMLFQLRCGSQLDADCWTALLANRRDAARGSAPDAAASLAGRPTVGVQGLLHSITLAAGLTDAPAPGWHLQALDAARLKIALQDVANCHFVLTASAPVHEVRIEDVDQRCCSRAPCA